MQNVVRKTPEWSLLTGNIATYIGGVQALLLAAERLL